MGDISHTDVSLATVRQRDSHHTSCLRTKEYPWMTAAPYQAHLNCTPIKFEEISNVLLAQPQLNSTHLFRADILHDSGGVLKTPAQTEASVHTTTSSQESRGDSDMAVRTAAWPLPIVAASIAALNLKLVRVVVRRLIPRKPRLDRALEQTCFMYREDHVAVGMEEQRLVVYRPHVQTPSEMPWYHPSVEALAFYYRRDALTSSVAVHVLPFGSDPIELMPDRLHRTMLSLLRTLCRLAKHDRPTTDQGWQQLGEEKASENVAASSSSFSMSSLSLDHKSLKDTIIPQHLVQDTYTRLKEVYAADLISGWVESTEPSKHVFEDLAIAAFLIELWRQMYPPPTPFPGFVDIACGNGILVYVLLREGYAGSGFDARRRKTWEILDIDANLTEQVCIPRPFLDALTSHTESILPGTQVHNGIFSPSTFMISNHADELTPWTPLLASLASPSAPNPFLIIPCCSHALSGAAHRYSPQDVTRTTTVDPDSEQPRTGDLKRLRATKRAVQGDDKSMYSCLTRKVAALAQDVGCSVELTLMRIPSTRNIGIVGNRRQSTDIGRKGPTFEAVIERECRLSGGIEAAARCWVARANKLQVGKGRGKVNEKRHKQVNLHSS